MKFSTPDLSDKYPSIPAMKIQFRRFGRKTFFSGTAVTIRCNEDNSLVKNCASQIGEGRIMVVDGGGSLGKALVGDKIALLAVSNGWAGFLINGAVRDVEILKDINLGILALGVSPMRTVKLGAGSVGIPLMLGGVQVNNGDYVYCDDNGVLVSEFDLLNQ